MGLDTVELVIEIEEEFEIKISDEVAERIRTVGNVYQYILECKGGKRGEACLSAASFYRLRRALMAVCGLDRRQVTPRADLNRLVPVDGRPETWERLRAALGLRIPELQSPRYFRTVSECLSIVSGLIAWPSVAILLHACLGAWPAACFVIGLLAGIGVAIATYRLVDFVLRARIDPHLTCFANGVVSVGQLATEVM